MLPRAKQFHFPSGATFALGLFVPLSLSLALAEASPTGSVLTKASVCLPTKLHSFSRLVLYAYLEGHMDTTEFRRWFSMPNSDYIMVSDCVAQRVDPSYIPEDKLPASTTLVPAQKGS